MNTERRIRSIIRESINEYIKEIDSAGTKAMYEAKMKACEEAISNRKKKIEMTESLEEMAGMFDETKINELKKEIKVLEKQHAKYGKMLEKLNKGKKVMTEEPVEEEAIDEADVTSEMDMTDEGVTINESFRKKQIISEEFKRMQKLAGIRLNEEVSNQNLNKAWIESHDSYEDLYIANTQKFNQYIKEIGFTPEYVINIDPGKIQMIYWDDEGPDSMSFDSIEEYIKESIASFWGEEQFIEKFDIEGEIDASGDDWQDVFDKHIENNLDLYFKTLNEYINDSYPDGDSANGVALLIDGKLVAGANNKKAITILQ